MTPPIPTTLDISIFLCIIYGSGTKFYYRDYQSHSTKERAMKTIKNPPPIKEQQGWMKHFKCTGEGNGDGGCKVTLLVAQTDLYHKPMSLYDQKKSGYVHKVTFCCHLCGKETDVFSPTSDMIGLFACGRRPSQAEQDAIPLR